MEGNYMFTRLEVLLVPNSIMDPQSRTKYVCEIHFLKAVHEKSSYYEIDLKQVIKGEDISDLLDEAKSIINSKTVS